MSHTALLQATAKPSKSVTVSGKANDPPTNATVEQAMSYRPANNPNHSSFSGSTRILVANNTVVIPPASIPPIVPKQLVFFKNDVFKKQLR